MIARAMRATANTNPVMLPSDFLVAYNARNWARLRDATVVSMVPTGKAS